MKKTILISATAVTILALITGVSATIYNSYECKYNKDTGNFISEGVEYKHGTMNDSLNCALLGFLPQVVIDRLGVYGDVNTQSFARHIIDINKDVLMKKTQDEKDKTQ
jgi:hypothetical protein|tara:strand:+ start:354 stop:677 length:324 start_codon:yes stop_codon:yes gene_type:complete